MSEKYVYSLNEEDFMELDELLDYIHDKKDEEYKVDFIYKGECKNYVHSDFFHKDDIIEEITNRAYEVGCDFSDNYCDEISLEIHKDNLSKIILDYLNTNVSQPSFYTVGKIIKIKYEDIL